MSSVYTIQSNNRTKTFVIITLFILLTTLVGYTAALYFNNYSFALIAFAISLIQSGIAYFFGDKVALASAGAQEISPEKAPQIHTLVENLCKIADIPKPKIYISPDPSANAFACGRDPKNASICLNQGILDLLDKNELEGVIAHELSHIKNRDTLVMTITMVLASVISFIVDNIFRFSFLGFGGNNDRESNRSPWVYILYIVMIVAAPLLAIIMQLAISRSREYLADATAVTFTRYPDGLISALEKLYSQKIPSTYRSTAMSSLYISPPKQSGGKILNNLFSTHPTIEERVSKLRGEN
jgi:heat shock protein HtpX